MPKCATCLVQLDDHSDIPQLMVDGKPVTWVRPVGPGRETQVWMAHVCAKHGVSFSLYSTTIHMKDATIDADVKTQLRERAAELRAKLAKEVSAAVVKALDEAVPPLVEMATYNGEVKDETPQGTTADVAPVKATSADTGDGPELSDDQRPTL